jgi:hypothetical protein
MEEVMVKKSNEILVRPVSIVDSGPGLAFRLTKEDVKTLGLDKKVKGSLRVQRVDADNGLKFRLEITAEWPAEKTVEKE